MPAPSARHAHRWIVLGTGTGVGKTYVARRLVELLARRGEPVAGLKPVETGIVDGGPQTDAVSLQRSSFHVKHPEPHPLYAFRDPVTPALAARRESQPIDLTRITEWLDTTRAADASSSPHLVIESAGGVFSPLGDGLTNFELASALGPAIWVLVAPDRLGVLHDVTCARLAMAARGRAPDCIVLSAPLEPDASTTTNAAELRRLPGIGPIFELPRGDTESLAPLLARPLAP